MFAKKKPAAPALAPDALADPVAAAADAATAAAKPKPEPELKPQPASPTRPERAVAQAKTASFLGGDLTFVGTLTSDGDVHLGGAFEGEVRASVVTVGGGGRVEGVITGRRVEVLGRVRGALTADEVRVRINAQVDGDVTSDSFALEAGARFEGCSRRKPA